MKRASLTRVSSLPSLPSLPSPSIPVSIPSPWKHPSADHSSGASPSSPSVFTLPSMRRPHPLDSVSSLATSSSSDYRRQSSAQSLDSASIRIVGGVPMSPSPSPSLARTNFDPSQLTTRPSKLVSMTTRSATDPGTVAGGCDQQATAPPNGTKPSDIPTPKTPGNMQHDGAHGNHKATPPDNEPSQLPVKRSVTDSSEGSYANYELESESENGEWEWNFAKSSAILLIIATGLAIAYFIVRKK